MRKIILATFAGTLIAGGAYANPGPDAAGAPVKGTLDKDIIRNVIKGHISEVKRCYESELLKNSSLAGKVMVRFTVGREGKVVESKVEESTLANPVAEKCITDAVLSWEFPKPKGGGVVVVSYPFVLATTEPAGDKPIPPKK